MAKKILCIALLLMLALAGSVSAATIKLTTYAESSLQLKPDAEEKWHFAEASSGWNPKNFFELKFDILPFKDFNIWMKASMSTSSDDRTNPLRFSYYDLHFKYMKMVGKGGFEVIGYAREDSYYWMDQPLFRLTDNSGAWGQGDDKGTKGSQNGFYFNGWKLFGLDLIRAVFVNDNMDSADQTFSAALRLRKDFFKGGLKVGLTGVGYRNSSKPVGKQGYEALAFDLDTSLLGPFQLTFETALCFNNELILESDPQQYAYKGELRGNFSLGSLGQTGFLASAYYSTPKFQNWRGNGSDGDNDDRFVERLEWYYNFPLKAIYVKNVLYYSHPVAGINRDNFHVWNYDYDYVSGLNTSTLRPQVTLENYSELYIEFINGFKFKSYYKHVKGGEYATGRFGQWNYLFFQLEVENRFAKIKPQVLLLNLDNADRRASAFGGEVLINLTDNIKFYTRFAMVAGSETIFYRSLEDKRNWSTFFCELQFLKLFSNTEIFLTWGNGDHTNDDLVHDKNGGILNGQSMEKRVNLYIKYWL